MSELYIPKDAYSMADCVNPGQIRLGVQGPPGGGKTYGALTAPNCIVADIDRGLKSHEGRSDIICVPFWDGAFCDRWEKRAGIVNPPNRRNALIRWLEKEATKFSEEQTLVIDSNRQVEIAFHSQYNVEKTPAANGKYNSFEEWTKKIEYFQELGVLYKSLKCNVIYLVHEVPARNDENQIIGLKPALTGSAGDTLASDFTDWFRAVCVAKPVTEMDKTNLKTKYGLEGKSLEEAMANSTNQTIYLWQTQGDMLFQAKTTLVNQPKYVPANWSVFSKYKRFTPIVGVK